jgi:hypothetical protein
MQAKKFQRRQEDFTCENCGKFVAGNGYTDHCPFCLWSKHVDIDPGDRLAVCQGMMKPMEIGLKAGQIIIHYKCQRCRQLHQVKAVENDSFEELVKLGK